MHWHRVICSDFGTVFQVDCHKLKGVSSFVCLRRLKGAHTFSTDYFVRGRGGCILFTAAIFCILCLFHVMNMQGGTLHTGQNQRCCRCGVWWMLDRCVLSEDTAEGKDRRIPHVLSSYRIPHLLPTRLARALWYSFWVQRLFFKPFSFVH